MTLCPACGFEAGSNRGYVRKYCSAFCYHTSGASSRAGSKAAKARRRSLALRQDAEKRLERLKASSDYQDRLAYERGLYDCGAV